MDLPRASGPAAVVEMRVTQVQWNSGPASLAGLRDVTELRRVEQLKSEIAERRRVDKLKDEWVETISHDLRTPLTIIKGAVCELHQGHAEPLQPQQAMLIGLARRQVERVERMVVNLLDLSRLESGHARVERKPLDAVALVRRVTGDFARAAAERAIRIDVECEPGAPALSADPDLFEQLVVNLVENALRFAHKLIGVRVRGGDGGAFEFSVQDDGVGIPPEKMNLLFTRFNQLERTRAPDGYKGTGLQARDLRGDRRPAPRTHRRRQRARAGRVVSREPAGGCDGQDRRAAAATIGPVIVRLAGTGEALNL